jgi:replicative DNA helicase
MSEYHSIESEQALLGAVLMNNAAFAVVDDILSADHFFEPIHREIWKVCAQLIGGGKLCNPVTIKIFLPDAKIGDMSMAEYLAALASEAVTVVNAPDFARIVRDMADRRLIIEVGWNCSSRKNGTIWRSRRGRWIISTGSWPRSR